MKTRISHAALSAALSEVPFLRVTAEAVTLEALQASAQAIDDEVADMVAKADDEGRDLTEAELNKIEAKKAELAKLDRQIAARSTRPTASLGRRSTPETREAGRESVPAEPKADAGKGGFRSFGEFAGAVRASVRVGGDVDNRIRAAAPTTSGSEGVGADGGFAVPPDFRNEIWLKVMGEESLVTRTDQLVTGGNSITLPADETTPWQSSGGIQAYWESELAAITQSKPALSYKNIRLNKLTALVPVSEELLEDAPGLDGYLRTKAPQKMQAKLNTAIIRGTGVGQPMGILTAPSLVTAAAVSGQGAGTVVYRNIVTMWSRLYAPCRRNAVWLINQDIEPQLLAMAFDHSSASPVPVYLPANGAAGSPFATLLGRPVIPVMPCSTLGTVGDIILVDLTQYMSVTKGQDIRTDVSMHLFFDAAALAFRFIMRVAGQPWWSSTIAVENGSNTLTWAVALSSTRT